MGAWNGGEAKRCGCGKVHDEASWRSLDFVGELDDGEDVIEIRNCSCLSSIAVLVTRRSTQLPCVLQAVS